jgi:hypothetical protein
MTSTQVAFVVTLALVLLVALVVMATSRRRRHHLLKDKFGPEYDRAVAQAGRVSKAEADLAARAQRIEQLHIRDLSGAERERYAELWRVAQQRFVDSPAAAVAEADRLVSEVMRVRGYPTGDFDQRAADLSVSHPVLVDSYRKAHDLAVLTESGKASTEDLRQALVHYRTLFEELLGAGTSKETEPEPEMVHT